MARPLAALFASRSRWFDLGVLLLGRARGPWSTVRLVQDGVPMAGWRWSASR